MGNEGLDERDPGKHRDVASGGVEAEGGGDFRGGIGEASDASATGIADSGGVGAFTRPTTSVAGTHAPDIPGVPHRWDERDDARDDESD